MSKKRPIVIAVDGTDGAGKSTAIEEVVHGLTLHGLRCKVMVDPGGTAIGTKIRKILLDIENKEMCEVTELHLYMASRGQLVHDMKQAIDSGDYDIIILDRYYYSTLAYQVFAQNKFVDDIDLITDSFVFPEPDVYFYLKCDPMVGLARLGKDREPDRLESNLERMKKIGDAYDKVYEYVCQDALNTPGKIYKNQFPTDKLDLDEYVHDMIADALYIYNRKNP